MLRSKLHSFVLSLMLAAVTAMAQTTPATMQEPAQVGGESPGLVVGSDPEYKNVLVGSLLGGASYGDHALTTATVNGAHYTGDTRFFFQPSIALQQTRPTVSWTLAYTPGISVSQHVRDDYQTTHNAAAELVLTPSHRLRLRLRQDYSVTDNPFETVGRVPGLAEPGGYMGIVTNNVLPYTKRTSMLSNADLTFRLAPHTAVGFTGGYQKFGFSAISGLPSPQGLLPSHSYNGSAFLSHQFSRSVSLGVQYAYFDIFTTSANRRQLALEKGDQRSALDHAQAHDILAFTRIQVTPRSSLTLFGGPEYSRSYTMLRTLGPAVQMPGGAILTPIFYSDNFSSGWHPAAGMTYVWTGVRNAFLAEFANRISDGGGVMGAITAMHGSLGFRSRVTQRWTAETRFEVTNQDSLESAFNQSFRAYVGSAGLSRDITQNLRIRFDYSRVHQSFESGMTAASPVLPGNQNLFQISLEYHFVKPVAN